MEMFGQACPNTGLNVANYSMAGFLEKHGTEEQKAKYLAKMMTCEVRSSMALTEPNAGSDLGKLRTTAKKNGDHWLINGSKIFISGAHSGGYEDISFVLARTDPNSTGLNGLSVFIAPRMIDGKANFKVPKIEDKVCLHASPTCELLFENTQATLFGEEGNGFRVMTDLMNGARLMMAALATGIAVGAMEEAKAYAKTRMTMGKPIIQHPMVSDMLYEMEIETRAMRAMISEAACAYDWMAIAEKKGDQKEFKRWKKRYRRLTPLCKYYCCEKAITIAKNAVQIFGGYGVCKDYPVERLWRETLIYPIYEGTSQIQSLMVLKDTLKDVASQASGFLGSLAGAWAESLVTRDPVKAKLLQGRNELNQGIKTVLMSIIREKFKSDIESLKAEKIQDFLKQFSLELLSAKTDLTYPFLWAERFTRITCDYYALKCMADHANSSDEEWKKWTLEFAALALPRMQLENTYMVNRLPSTLEYLEKQKES
jgi:alkylation response protein AidB-like acyl-CoA dehydrogenase